MRASGRRTALSMDEWHVVAGSDMLLRVAIERDIVDHRWIVAGCLKSFASAVRIVGLGANISEPVSRDTVMRTVGSMCSDPEECTLFAWMCVFAPRWFSAWNGAKKEDVLGWIILTLALGGRRVIDPSPCYDDGVKIISKIGILSAVALIDLLGMDTGMKTLRYMQFSDADVADIRRHMIRAGKK